MNEITCDFKPIDSSVINVMKQWADLVQTPKNNEFGVTIYNLKKWQKFIPMFILKLFVKPDVYKCTGISMVNPPPADGDSVCVSYEYVSK